MVQKISLYMTMIIILFAVAVSAAPASSYAEDPSVADTMNGEEVEEQPAEAEDSEESLVMEERSMAAIIGQLVLYTLLIVVLIYGLIKFLAKRQKNLQPNQAVQLVGGTSLGNSKSLQLVKVGDKVLLVGVGEQVTLIKEFSEEDGLGDIENSAEKPPMLGAGTISEWLKGLKNSGTEPKKEKGFDQLFKQSLTKQKMKQHELKQELREEETDEDKEGRSS